ncbi:hypothetical protein [Accumulibacter sp.]|uniref:hypothetical protein n=1 Tax=Accumulibacter sp. TaxID=2053492 RepID=UPI0035B01885
MFNWLKKGKPARRVTVRDMCFGDLRIEEWAKEENAHQEPWSSFVQARRSLEARETAAAIRTLRQITEMPGLESRHYVQAWHFLRGLGVNPPAEQAKTVHGVVVEVGMENGADIVAAYGDGSARYLNFSGAGVFWERADDSLDAEIEALLAAGREVAKMIGPWDKERPEAPSNGKVRLNMLTPSGLHFGYGDFATLAKDPMGAALINPATRLMVKLTELRQQ